MCGRYSLTQPATRILERLGLAVPKPFLPRYNIAPGQEVPLVVADRRSRVVPMRWGLVPFWSESDEIGAKLINAPAETLAQRRAFSTSFALRRCLVLADGYYEWAQDRYGKQPVRVVLASRLPFAFAGLWDRWTRSDGQELRTFVIITTEAHEFLRPIHHRMPVILAEECYVPWLDSKRMRPDQLLPLLQGVPSDSLACYPIDPVVNNSAHDWRACIEPIPWRRPSRPKPGQIVRVRHCTHSYELPNDLEPGTLVKLIAFKPGAWTVEANGRRWELSMTNIDPGEECFVAGQWWHESCEIVQQQLARLAKWTGHAETYTLATLRRHDVFTCHDTTLLA